MLDVFNVCKIHHMGNCIFCGGQSITIERVPQDERLVKRYRELWSELHTTVTFDTLKQWEANIPKADCDCNKFYVNWKAHHPPPADNFFAWTVELHNAVNDKLGKPTLTLEEARQIWMV